MMKRPERFTENMDDTTLKLKKQLDEANARAEKLASKLTLLNAAITSLVETHCLDRKIDELFKALIKDSDELLAEYRGESKGMSDETR